MSSPLARSAGFLAIALTLGLSACSSDDALPSAGDSSAASSSGEATADPAGEGVSPIDVCSVVSAEDVSAVIGEAVMATPMDVGCTYIYGDGGNGAVIIAQTDIGGGLGTAQADSVSALGEEAQPVDVAGNEGYVVIGQQGDGFAGEGAVAVDGLIVGASVTGRGAAEEIFTLVQGLLELVVDSL